MRSCATRWFCVGVAVACFRPTLMHLASRGAYTSFRKRKGLEATAEEKEEKDGA